MNIFVSVDGKWSVELEMKIYKTKLEVQENGESKEVDISYKRIFKTTDDLKSGAKKKAEYQALNEKLGYSDFMKEVSKNIPNYKYKGIELNTVQGILARMIGEVRRLKEVLEDKEHPLYKIKDRIEFVFHRHSFQNEVIRLASFRKDAPQPHGVINNCFKDSYPLEEWRGKELPLLFRNEFSECLFSIFELKSKEEVFDFLKILSSDDHEKKTLILRRKTDKEISLSRFNDEMNKWGKITAKFAEKKKRDKSDKEGEFSHSFLEFCNFVKVDPEKFQYGNMMGVLFIKLISFIKENHLEWKKYVMALSMNPNSETIVSGFHSKRYNFTFKDFASAYFGVASNVYGGVYVAQLQPGMSDKSKEMITPAQIGISRESGILEIQLDLSIEEELEWKRLIEESGVNVFQVGKKGLGYIKEIKSFGYLKN